MNKIIEKTINVLDEYKKLGLASVHNFEQFNNMALAHHSSALEGSTLSLSETITLLTEGTTAKGKPLVDHLMVKDHYNALLYTLDLADKKRATGEELNQQEVQKIVSLVCEHNNEIVQNVLGTTDTAKGDFRRTNVYAGVTTFMGYDKVPAAVTSFVGGINIALKTYERNPTIEKQLMLSFEAHYRLVTIHPFTDGNGRTSRLLANFVQRYFELPLGLVLATSKTDYVNALVETRKTESLLPINTFMCSQYVEHLENTIKQFKSKDKGNNKGLSFSVFF